MVGFCIIFFLMQNCLWVFFCPFSNMNTCRQFYHLNKLTQILQQDEITKKIYFAFLARYCKWETFWGQTFFLKASSVVAHRNLMALKEQKAWYGILRRNPFKKAVWSNVALSFIFQQIHYGWLHGRGLLIPDDVWCNFDFEVSSI